MKQRHTSDKWYLAIIDFSCSMVGASCGAVLATRFTSDRILLGALVGCFAGRVLAIPLCVMFAVAIGAVGSIFARGLMHSFSDKTFFRLFMYVISLAALVGCFPLYKAVHMTGFLIVLAAATFVSLGSPKLWKKR